MNALYRRLQIEKEHQAGSPSQSQEKKPLADQKSFHALLGNIQEWLKEGENQGLLKFDRNLETQHTDCGTNRLGVDFGQGRLLEVAPVRGERSDCVTMRFQGCRKTGSIQLRYQSDHWLIWPKNSIRQLPMAWSSKVFFDLLDDMI